MTNKCEIVKADKFFFDTFLKIKSEDKNILWSGHETKPDRSRLMDWYLDQLVKDSREIFKVVLNLQDVGYIYLDKLDQNEYEISYAIFEAYEKRGVISKAINELLKHFRSKKKPLKIVANVASINIASQKVLLKNNFKKTGRTSKKFFKKLNKDIVMEEHVYYIYNVFIIAEAGVNHNGDINLAKKLIDIAVDAQCDAVKFQTWKTELLVTKSARLAEYQVMNTTGVESQFQMLKRLELSYDDFKELKSYCDDKKIIFLSTPDEEESALFLKELQDVYKIGSGELTNIPFLRFIGGLNKKVIMSTGMGTLGEVEEAIDTLVSAGTSKENITILHATTQYPTLMQDVNLSAMQTIKAAFDIAVGYSDHTLGIEVPIAAVAMGATVIEKHFTIDKNMQGPDHKASLNPEELKNMVKAIRDIEFALGSGIKKPTPMEVENKMIVRKVIVAKKTISKGDLFSEDNLTVKRSSEGIPANRWDQIIHKTAERNYEVDQVI